MVLVPSGVHPPHPFFAFNRQPTRMSSVAVIQPHQAIGGVWTLHIHLLIRLLPEGLSLRVLLFGKGETFEFREGCGSIPTPTK